MKKNLGFLFLTAAIIAVLGFSGFVRAEELTLTDSNSLSGAVDLPEPIVEPVAPAAPTNLLYAGYRVRRIRSIWTASTDPVTGYGIERAIITDLAAMQHGPWEEIGTTSADVTSYLDAGLPDGAGYLYRVRAYNGELASVYTKVMPAYTAPSTPTGLKVGSKHCGQVDISWDRNAGPNVAHMFGYIVYRDGTAIAGIPSYAIHIEDKNVVAGSTYSYTVAGYNAAGSRSFQTAPVSITVDSCVNPARTR